MYVLYEVYVLYNGRGTMGDMAAADLRGGHAARDMRGARALTSG
jgi:hypothetical protein